MSSEVLDDSLDRQMQFWQAQKMEAIGTLAGGVAHDFNNSLTVIMGYAELLMLKIDSSHPMYEDLERIRKVATSASALTRKLLSFSRRQVSQPKVMNLNVALGETTGMLRRLINENIELDTHFEKDLDNVKFDAYHIEHILVNLALNARDAMPDGGKLMIETANVWLDGTYAAWHESVQPGPYVMISVSDTGVGMDKETQQCIFEPYFTTKGDGLGTGLGLSTIYGIVKQGGGNIWAYSEPGKGTTFKIYLPAIKDKAESDEIKNECASLPGKAETILLVEDAKTVRRVLTRVLSENGYNVLDARDYEEAIQFSKQYTSPIHLLLTDVVMPGMNGIKLADHLSSRRPDMKVLYMSGYTKNMIVQNGMLNKGMAFINKPCSVYEITKKIREVLDLPTEMTGNG